LERISRENNIVVNSSSPSVAYKETISTPCFNCEGKFIKQSGGRGQYGHVVIDLEPRKLGSGYKFVNKIKGGSIPKEYIPSINKGIIDSCDKGTILGYPIVDIKVTLKDGSFHEVDSNENAFKISGSLALKEAVRRSKPYILEPIMEVVVETPHIYIGKIIGNLTSKRGNVFSNIDLENFNIIKSYVPLNEMFKYSTPLRSISQGRASYSMRFFKYKKLPENLYEKINKKI